MFYAYVTVLLSPQSSLGFGDWAEDQEILHFRSYLRKSKGISIKLDP